MKTPMIFLAALLAIPFSAQAKIDVRASTSVAESTDAEGTFLTKALRSLGVKGFTSSVGYATLKVKGGIHVTNGAACDNGHRTYRITLTELNEAEQEVRTIELDGSDACTKPSKAEKLNALLDRWGGSILLADCGAGQCWQKIDSIECMHFEKSANYKAFDSCTVIMSSGQ